MKKFLFRFGFCTPEQWICNDQNGWDDESSQAFYIEAINAEDANKRGQEIAEVYCHTLFEKFGWQGAIPSWKESNFSFWIDENVKEIETSLPTILIGTNPDFAQWD